MTAANKYDQLTGKAPKRKATENADESAKKPKSENFSKNGNAPGQRISSKPGNKFGKDSFKKSFSKDNKFGKEPFKKSFDKDNKFGKEPFKKSFSKENKFGKEPFKKSFDKDNKFKKPDMHKFKAGANGKLYGKSDGKPFERKEAPKPAKPEVPMKKKELKKERRQKKLGDSDYEVQSNMKKIWETLRRADTTDEAKKKTLHFIIR